MCNLLLHLINRIFIKLHVYVYKVRHLIFCHAINYYYSGSHFKISKISAMEVDDNSQASHWSICDVCRHFKIERNSGITDLLITSWFNIWYCWLMIVSIKSWQAINTVTEFQILTVLDYRYRKPGFSRVESKILKLWLALNTRKP